MENTENKNGERKFVIRIVIAALLIIGLVFAAIAIENKSDRDQTIAQLNENELPQLSADVSANESLVLVHTTAGDIKIKLFNQFAPLAVENFITHAKNGYYNNTKFHRVIKDFMIQGGDPNGDGTGGQSIWKDIDPSIDGGTGFVNETNMNLYNIRGALSMANQGGEATNGSQFFIVSNAQDQSGQLDQLQYPTKIIEAYKKGGQPSLDGYYTVFGQVIEGMDVVDSIAGAETIQEDGDSQLNENSTPVNPVLITSIEILQEAQK